MRRTLARAAVAVAIAAVVLFAVVAIAGVWGFIPQELGNKLGTTLFVILTMSILTWLFLAILLHPIWGIHRHDDDDHPRLQP